MPMSRSTRVLAPVVLLLLLVAGAALARCEWEPRTAASPVQLTSATRGGLPAQGWWHFAPTTTTTAPPPTTTTQVPPPPPTTHHAAPVAHAAPRRSRGGHWHPGGPCSRPSQCPQLRQCENGGSYSHGTSSQFDGAYQFADRSQWGMSAGQQDAQADAMYADRGADPWPTCGRYLA